MICSRVVLISMKVLLEFLLSFFLLSTILLGQSPERPEGIVIPVSSIDDITETRRLILQNTLIESFNSFYRLVSQDKLEEVQERVFEEMDYDQFTEDQCFLMIQDALQVENLFVLQVIGENQDTQMSLKWVGLDENRLEQISEEDVTPLNRTIV